MNDQTEAQRYKAIADGYKAVIDDAFKAVSHPKLPNENFNVAVRRVVSERDDWIAMATRLYHAGKGNLMGGDWDDVYAGFEAMRDKPVS